MLTKVLVNGTAHIVDAPTNAAAKAWALEQLKTDIQISPATASDLAGVDFSAVPVLTANKRGPKGKNGQEGEAAEGGI